MPEPTVLLLSPSTVSSRTNIYPAFLYSASAACCISAVLSSSRETFRRRHSSSANWSISRAIPRRRAEGSIAPHDFFPPITRACATPSIQHERRSEQPPTARPAPSSRTVRQPATQNKQSDRGEINTDRE